MAPLRGAAAMTAGPSVRGEVARVQVPASDAAWVALDAALRDMTGDVRVLVVRLLPDDESRPSVAVNVRQRVIDYLARPDLLSVGVLAHAVGSAGLAVALACDLRVLGDDAEFAVTDAAVFGVLGRLGWLVGYPRALELSSTGRRLSAREAESLGLANLVVRGDQIDDAVDDLIAALLATPRAMATEIKAALRAALAPSGLDVAGERRRIADELAAADRLVRDDE